MKLYCDSAFEYFREWFRLKMKSSFQMACLFLLTLKILQFNCFCFIFPEISHLNWSVTVATGNKNVYASYVIVMNMLKRENKKRRNQSVAYDCVYYCRRDSCRSHVEYTLCIPIVGSPFVARYHFGDILFRIDACISVFMYWLYIVFRLSVAFGVVDWMNITTTKKKKKSSSRYSYWLDAFSICDYTYIASLFNTFFI